MDFTRSLKGKAEVASQDQVTHKQAKKKTRRPRKSIAKSKRKTSHFLTSSSKAFSLIFVTKFEGKSDHIVRTSVFKY